MRSLLKSFQSRENLVRYVRELAPWAQGGASAIIGGRAQADKLLALIEPINYGSTRNYGDGKVTKLSPYIHHGIVGLDEVRNIALQKCSQPEQVAKFIQELAWRDFWQRVAAQHPEWIWHDVEEYKTGFSAEDYADDLPDDIASGKTGVACIDAFIGNLINDGYVHNHGRMYIASYVVHFRNVKWQAGAKWFLTHLLDGDEASNNLSWQWVASTFSNKPYIFNLENVNKYFAGLVDTAPESNQALDASYEELTQRLFPMLGDNDA